MKSIPYAAMVVLALASPAAWATTIEMNINGLVCAFCAQGIEKKLRKLPATADVLVSFEQHLVAIALKDGQDIADADLRRAMTDAGYTVTAIRHTDTPIGDIRARTRTGKS